MEVVNTCAIERDVGPIVSLSNINTEKGRRPQDLAKDRHGSTLSRREIENH